MQSIAERAYRNTLSTGWDSIQGIAWSPGNDEIWFTATRTGGDRSLYAVNLSGTVRLLARVPGELTLLDVDRDGNVLLTRGNDRAGMIGLTPGDAKERDLSWLDWSVPGDLSADGRIALFSETGEGGGPKYAVYLRKTMVRRPFVSVKVLGLHYRLTGKGRLRGPISLRHRWFRCRPGSVKPSPSPMIP